MAGLLTPQGTTLELPAMLSVFCLIRNHVPVSAEEGVRLNVPDINQLQDVTGGDNIYEYERIA